MPTQVTGFGGNFDRVAPVYDALSFIVFGRSLLQAQTTFLSAIPGNASILIVGGGTGMVLEQVLLQCHPRRVLYLEASARMLARASGRMLRRPLLGSVEFRLGDETALQPDERFDVIMTPFVLDLFTGQTLANTILPRLRRTLAPGGLWLVTDFVRMEKWQHQTLIGLMIAFFRLTAGIETQQLADWPKLLSEQGVTLTRSQSAVGGMVVSQVWQAATVS
ncbi:class I SAM-dependent methyltransferase [Fibrisoma montanum]|uniref:Class I SAM-dependent methyltransferase n=1 Tax=Fibrisoma montanum TaxID=2305895 RepID=A0A418LXW1_9BACT|nr:class I SAM-dependent methyltransferase [Fibrisoma montanum]RIV18001.1 class I SAM-dependent methyltransferase [Fibrisoma montanum]